MCRDGLIGILMGDGHCYHDIPQEEGKKIMTNHGRFSQLKYPGEYLMECCKCGKRQWYYGDGPD